MPDATGSFKGVSVPAEAWDRIFGSNKALGNLDATASSQVPLGPAEQLRADFEKHMHTFQPQAPFLERFKIIRDFNTPPVAVRSVNVRPASVKRVQTRAEIKRVMGS